MKGFYITLIILLALVIWQRAQILALAARIKYQDGKTDKSLQLFGIANRIGKLTPSDLLYYGYVLLRTGDLSLAQEVLTRASLDAKKDADKKRIKAMLALVVWKDGDLDSAIEMMENVMLDGYQHTNAYQNLGLMYIIKGDAQKALKFNLEAYEYNSDDLVILDNLAESYAICGDAEKAKEIYENLLEKQPHFPEPYYSYGMMLIAEGEKEKGLSLMREALSKRFTFLSIKSKEEIEQLILENE